MHGAVGMNGEDPAVAAIAAMIAVDQSMRGLERDRLALGAPAEQGRMREHIDLARLHHGAARRRVHGRALEGEALDEAAARRIESGFAPERQRVLDDPAFEARDGAFDVSVSCRDRPRRCGALAPSRLRRRASHGAHNTSPTSP